MLRVERMFCVIGIIFYFLFITSTSGLIPDGSICLNETLLKSTFLSTCGDHVCEYGSHCGDDGRCLYCTDTDCDTSSPGCEIFCLLRSRDDKLYFNAGNISSTERSNEVGLLSNHYFLMSSALNLTLIFVIIFTQRQWIATNVLMRVSEWRSNRSKKNITLPVVVNSSLEGQTAMLITGKDSSHRDDLTSSV